MIFDKILKKVKGLVHDFDKILKKLKGLVHVF